jgi:hypothetical protein
MSVGKRVAILQSNYIPWKGYFDIIANVDLFVFHDDLQYTKGDWRNRNKIKTPHGLKWLTIPCGSDESRLICDVKLPNSSWQKQHWNQIVQFYGKARYFKKYDAIFSKIYLDEKWDNLSQLNHRLIRTIALDILGIETEIIDSRCFGLTSTKSARVLEIVQRCDGTVYLSGSAGKNYLDVDSFTAKGISMEWMSYSDYPVYDQLHPPFEHGVSVLDLLFNVGSDARNHIKY